MKIFHEAGEKKNYPNFKSNISTPRHATANQLAVRGVKLDPVNYLEGALKCWFL
jgi:hypothetical protein